MSPSKVESKFLEFCHAHFDRGKSILIAVSGGSDSIALLRLFEKFQTDLQLKHIGVIHVNHGLRGEESDRDEQFVRECAQQFNLPFFVKRLSGKSGDSSGIEEWARKERYSFFMSVMESAQFEYLVTAHTLDDQAETVLMRLMRGSGIRGLRGILPLREDRVYRPLLKLEKSDLENWLTEIGQTYRFDSSNDDTRFRRNMVRLKVIPMLKSIAPDISENLVFLGDHMYSAWEKMIPEINNWIRQYVIRDSRTSFSIDKEGVAEKTSLSIEALRSILEEFRIAASRKQVDAVFENRDKKGEFLLPGGWAYRIVKGRALFYNRNQSHSFSYNLAVPGITDFHDLNKSFHITIEDVPDETAIPHDNTTVVIDRQTTGGDLLFRSIDDGDLFQPFGKKREIWLKEFLSKQGISRPLWQNFGIVTDQYNKILWVPGIRINEQCKVSDCTREVIKISMKTLTTDI
jgi:tRNA(Ile)-lysidine synthase